jgi:glycosyltransferase involved in cell wall biosynthesis
VRTHLDLLAHALPELPHHLVLLGDRNEEPGPGFRSVTRVPFARRKPWTWRRAAAALREVREPAVLHGHSTFGGWVAALAHDGRPVVYTPHAHFTMIPTRGPKTAAKKALVRFERRLVPRAAVLVACGREEQAFIEASLPGRRVLLLPHGYDLPADTPPRAERPIDYLFLGRFDWQKDPEAFVDFAARHPDAVCVAAGDGPLRPACLEKARRLGLANLSFPGRVDETSSWMRRAKTFVLSSRYEGRPYSILEAKAAGCEVLALGKGPGMSTLADEPIPPLVESFQPLAALYAELAGRSTARAQG